MIGSFLNRANRCAAFINLVTIIVFSTALAAGPDAMKPNCSDPRDYAELVHCFLAQFSCLPSYFGIDGTPDYPKALQCFESHKFWDFTALMYLNGEGTPRDLEKATAALDAWKNEGPDKFNPDQGATLKSAIDRCRRHPQSCLRVDYCKQLSEGTPEIEICEALDELAGEAVFSRAIATTRSELGLADRALFDRTILNFKAYQLDDMQRQYQAFIDASLRDVAGASQADVIRGNFMKLMENEIQSRSLRPSTINSYNVLQSKLNRELADNLSERIRSWQDDLGDPQAKEQWDRDKSSIGDYTKAARESQLQWIRFRDSCATLATSLYRDRKFDPALSMKALVTRNRIAELRSDPFAPESQSVSSRLR
jgi:hypothetical protein